MMGSYLMFGGDEIEGVSVWCGRYAVGGGRNSTLRGVGRCHMLRL